MDNLYSGRDKSVESSPTASEADKRQSFNDRLNAARKSDAGSTPTTMQFRNITDFGNGGRR